MRFLLLGFVVGMIPVGVFAMTPTSPFDASSESVNREVKRVIDWEGLRARLSKRLSRPRVVQEVPPIVKTNTVVRRTKKSVGSVNTVGYREQDLHHLDFSVSIPEGFSVVEDTLMQKSGKAIFRSGTNVIELHASGLQCPASGTQLRNCVQSNTKAFANAFVSEDRRLQFLRQRQDNLLLLNVGSESDPFGSERRKIVESLELQSSTKKITVLGFSSPGEESLWYLVLSGNDKKETSIGQDHQALYRIFNSLTESESPKTIPARRTVTRTYQARDRFRSNYTFKSNKADVTAAQIFTPKHIPEFGLNFKVMQKARLVQDGLDGTYIYRGETGEVIISKLAEECAGNTSNLLQRCLKQRLDEIDDEPEGFRIVTEKNVLMELDKTVGYKNHLGRYILWQKQGDARRGILVFRHPWKPFVLRVDFFSDVKKENWTYNEVLLKSFLSSFYFDERE
mgnify:CR=1 FL=1